MPGDYRRINAGVVALGESLRLIAADKLIPNYMRVEATTERYNKKGLMQKPPTKTGTVEFYKALE